jgi:hypothetical protein
MSGSKSGSDAPSWRKDDNNSHHGRSNDGVDGSKKKMSSPLKTHTWWGWHRGNRCKGDTNELQAAAFW